MIFTIKITTLDNRKITVEGDNKKQLDLTISEYYDLAKNITVNCYKDDSIEIIK
jgi:hypothetical protein